MRDYLSVNPDSPLERRPDDASLEKLLHMKAGFHTLRDVDEQTRFFFVPDEGIDYAPDAVEKVLKKNNALGLAALRDLRDVLAGMSEWTAAALELTVKAYGDQKQLGLGKIAQPLRVAICGTTISPPIFQSLEFLGQPRTLARIDRCLAAVSA